MVPLPAGAARARYKSPNEKLNIAVIGSGGKGAGDTDHCAELGENIVALCDVDEDTLNARRQKYPQAKLFRDYRKMLDEIGKDENGRPIEILFGALAMQQWGIRPVPDEEKLDLSHYSDEFVEF